MLSTRYTADHLWIRRHDGGATIGLTRFARDALGEIVLVRLPEPGRAVRAGEPCGAVESTKVASDLLAPVAGRIVEANAAAAASPALVTRDAEGAGWLYRMVPDDPADLQALLDLAAYDALVRAL